MPRSHKIYVVVSYADGIVVAAFTVKHELLTYLKKWDDGQLSSFSVQTVNDDGKGGQWSIRRADRYLQDAEK